MTAAEMREAAAKLCEHELAACKIRIEEARSNSEAHEWKAAYNTAKELTHRIRAIPLPDDDGMVEMMAEAMFEAEFGIPATEKWTHLFKEYHCLARAAIRAINGGKP
jgi:hypothetical protein